MYRRNEETVQSKCGHGMACPNSNNSRHISIIGSQEFTSWDALYADNKIPET